MRRFHIISCVLVGCRAALPAPFVMPWLCLERCGDDAADIAAQLAQFAANSTVLVSASFEDYNLGPNSTLIKNNLTQVASVLKKTGSTYAMVSSYPYPTAFLSWMREVFAAPEPFIASCVAAAATENLSGMNIDWEPTDGGGDPTPQDAADYAAFLDLLATRLHAVGVQVTVDVAEWSPIWNLTAIGETNVDAVFTMGTYTASWEEFKIQLADAVVAVPASKLVIGLETTHDTDGSPYTDAELTQRFDLIRAHGLRRVGLWRAPVPDNWWPFLDAL